MNKKSALCMIHYADFVKECLKADSRGDLSLTIMGPLFAESGKGCSKTAGCLLSWFSFFQPSILMCYG